MPSPQVLTDVQLLMGAYNLSPFSGAFDHSAEATFLPARNFEGRGYEIIIPAGIKATSSITGNADLQSGGVSCPHQGQPPPEKRFLQENSEPHSPATALPAAHFAVRFHESDQ